MNAAIYARYSSDRQDEGSITAQVRACTEYAEQNKHNVILVYKDEAVSGTGTKTAKRKEYQRMLRDAERGLFDAILIHKYDRVARNLQEHVNLEARLDKAGVQLVAVAQNFGGTKESKIIKALMWAMSEYYSDNLSEEVKKGHKEKALKAMHNGGYAPFGYDVIDQSYVINDFEAGFVRRMFECAANRRGFAKLVGEMAAAGVVGKRGQPIKYPQIYEILRNEKYTGTYVYCPQIGNTREGRRIKGEAIRIENALPAIVSKEMFEEVREIMTAKRQTGRKQNNYLCSGLVYCSCGEKMHAFTSKKDGNEYSYYVCSAKCGAARIRMEKVDEAAIAYLRELLSEKNQKEIADTLQEYMGQEKNRIKEHNAAIKKAVAEKQRQYNTYMDRLGSNEAMPDPVLRDIGQKMEKLLTEIKTLEEMPAPKDYTDQQIFAWLDSIKAAPDEKGIYLLIEKIHVGNDKKEIAFSIRSKLNAILPEIGGKIGRGERI